MEEVARTLTPMPQKLPMDVVCGEITHQNNAQPGPCGTHSHRAIVSTSDGVTLRRDRRPGQCRIVLAERAARQPDPRRARHHRRSVRPAAHPMVLPRIPSSAPCNSPSMMMTEEVLSSLLLNPAALKAPKQAMEAV